MSNNNSLSNTFPVVFVPLTTTLKGHAVASISSIESFGEAGYKIIPSSGNGDVKALTDITHDSIHDAASSSSGDESHVVTFLLIAVAVIGFIILLTSVLFYIVKRSRLDKMRHHLMPLYNFAPTADEEPHWEADLLEDDREQQISLNAPCTAMRPKLKFHSHGALDI